MFGEQVALVANIGGTHARFGLALPSRAGRPEVVAVGQYLTADFASFSDAAGHYLGGVGAEKPTQGVFAVASAVTGDQVKITNNPWTFSIREMRRDLRLDGVRVINDFSALSRSLPWLQPGDVHAIGAVPPRSAPGVDATYAVVGPGTGLGVGCLAMRGGQGVVIESEGGHVSFAPGDRYEMRVLELLFERYGRVSAERLISGTGLLNLYQAVCAIEGTPAQLETPAAVTAHAVADRAGPCGRTLELFWSLLGSFAGDAALSFGAWDGVFIAGGVAQKILPWLEAGAFRRRFEDKGRHQALMRAIPTQVVLHPHAELLGVASLRMGGGAAPNSPCAGE